MKQKTAIFLALALTVFVMVLSAAVVMNISGKVKEQVAASTLVAPTDVIENVSAKEMDTPTVTALPTNTQTSVPTNTATLSVTPLAVLVPERATQIAFTVYPNSRVRRTPELVNYKGKMAYEVLLNRGTVYVDAFDGTVLAKFAAPKPTPTTAPTIEPPTAPSDPNAGNSGGGGGGGGDNGGPQRQDPSSGPTAPQAPQIPPPATGGGGGGGNGGGQHDGGDHDDDGGHDDGGHDDGGHDG